MSNTPEGKINSFIADLFVLNFFKFKSTHWGCKIDQAPYNVVHGMNQGICQRSLLICD